MSYCNNLASLNATRLRANTGRTRRVLGSLLLALLASQPAVAKFEDYLTKRWFNIEVIVFERSNIDNKNTLEELTRTRPAADPDALDTELDAPASTLFSEPTPLLAANELPAEEAALLVAREPTQQRSLLETPISVIEDPDKEALRFNFLQAINAYEFELESRNLTFVPDENPRLSDELQRLARPRNHSVVWRGHWLQAVPERKNPQPLSIEANELESGEFQLTGSLEVTVNRYLHLNAELWYHDPLFNPDYLSNQFADIDTQTQPTTTDRFRQRPAEQPPLAPSRVEQSSMEQSLPEPMFMVLDESRRMRSGILHYLDHPKLGLLVRIDKLKIPDELLAQYKLFEASQQ